MDLIFFEFFFTLKRNNMDKIVFKDLEVKNFQSFDTQLLYIWKCVYNYPFSLLNQLGLNIPRELELSL